ncbi:thiol-disulfide oxidoreductase DCC family protein [Virgibacillus ainsalahensis]
MRKHIVFYDAECPLCRTVKAFLKKLDWLEAIAWYPVQEISETTRQRVNAYKNMYDEIYMYTKDKKVLTGFYTVRKIFSLLPVTIPLAALMHFPFAKNIGSPAYLFISKRRYRWFGRVPYDKS